MWQLHLGFSLTRVILGPSWAREMRLSIRIPTKWLEHVAAVVFAWSIVQRDRGLTRPHYWNWSRCAMQSMWWCYYKHIPITTPTRLPIPNKKMWSRIRIVYHNCHLGRGTAKTILLCHVFLVASLLLLFLFIPSCFITGALLDRGELTLTKHIEHTNSFMRFQKIRKKLL